MAETDMFLKIDGIDGESQDSKFKDWIEVLSWNWSVHQASTAGKHTGGGGHSKASFAELHISKPMDKASVKLFKACAKGEHIKKAKLVCRKAGGDPLEYYTIEMDDVLITNVAHSGHGGGASQISDTVALSFAKFKKIYKLQSKQGTADSNVDWGFSINEHKEV